MIELKIIDGKPFIASRTGKRETVQTLADFSADARQCIAQAVACVASLRSAEAKAQARLESAALAGDSTTVARAELGAIAEEITGHERDAADAMALIREVTTLIDTHAAAGIREADTRRLADLLAPFDKSLMEFTRDR